jgi:pilus assembly protein CpaB
MAAERKQYRILSVTTRLACGFTTFLLAVILSTHSNPLDPNVSPGDLDNQSLPIVVARVEIPAGTRITAEQLTLAHFPPTVMPDKSFARLDDKILGRIAVVRISPREPVTESRLSPVGAAGGLSSVIPEGYRAMTVRVDHVIGFSGFIMPGTRVDILVSIIPIDNSKQRKEDFAKIVLQNVKVLASGQNIHKPKNEKGLERVTAVTLQVTPEQAEKLALASMEGKLRLVMRNEVD